jgi:hypothetical protein
VAISDKSTKSQVKQQRSRSLQEGRTQRDLAPPSWPGTPIADGDVLSTRTCRCPRDHVV